MRVLPIDELDPQSIGEERLRLIFPYASGQAAGAGDPANLARGTAADLFLLALIRLMRGLGEPDAPSLERARQADEGDELRAVWDFDYHLVVLRVVQAEPGLWSVELSREKP